MKETKRIKTRILMKRDSSEHWVESNPILAQGEIGYDITIKKCKIGDGVNHWNDLPFFALQGSDFAEKIDYEVRIINKPKIESHELIGNKTFEELGISSIEADDLLNILT